MNKWPLAILLALIMVLPLGALAYYFTVNHQMVEQGPQSIAVIDYMTQEEKLMEPGTEFKVVQCHVVDGYKFGVLLDNGKWIIAHLSVATKAEATEEVVDLLKKSQAPTIILRRELNDYWIVDFHLTVEGKEIMLRSLLEEQNLAL